MTSTVERGYRREPARRQDAGADRRARSSRRPAPDPRVPSPPRRLPPGMHPAEVTGPTQLIEAPAPTLLPGVEAVGEFEGSGYKQPPQLVCRADGQLVRLPPLLYLLVTLLDERKELFVDEGRPATHRTLHSVAAALRFETGDGYLAEHVAFLVDQKLAPLGVTTYSDGTVPEIERSDPFLALRYKFTVVSEKLSWRLAGMGSWLFHPVVMAAVLSGFVIAEAWALLYQDMGYALQQVLLNPVDLLLVVVISFASTGFHEIGHAAACRYGGARPGTMGCGIYLVWPAFYTDITNSYRLGRGGRVRADLGGVYFNALGVVVLAACYGWTGNPLFLVALLSTNLEIVQQLLPSLRFDGYHIMADLVGIPDLFKYIGPILRRVILRRPAEPLLDELKRWPQIFISVWVLFVIPALFLQLGLIVVQLPDLVRNVVAKSERLVGELGGSGNVVLDGASAFVQIALMAIPVLGVALVLWQLTRSLLRWAVPKIRGRVGAGASGDGSAPRPAATTGGRNSGRHRLPRKWSDCADGQAWREATTYRVGADGGSRKWADHLLRVDARGAGGALVMVRAGCKHDH
ncbi:putative peptide zinc metalloprotease protein [Pseudonocardia sediminis]|uniref:Putative peptide zinc metalloprotease protein n=1 Tax=Pseudonocardia sediminis TaxID=1397368 RepID=A0A4Q7V0Y9_PSEST|nr:hypothetical protein [Pseudonocardia sediminis]RZT88142.1 putative peptide zinc metalloprotease protein [Pseudonocardia sediminis]